MSCAFLAEWLDAVREKPGLSVQAVDPERLFCVDPGEGPLLAIEWEPPSHTLHLYGHPGHASAPPVQPRVLEFGTGVDERRSLHVQGGTGLMTLSVKRSLASLDRMAFVALVNDVLADMALWGMLCGEAPLEGPHAAAPAMGALPPGVIRA